MKYGKVIRPKDVPAMMRSGELEFGMRLQFSVDKESWSHPITFVGFYPQKNIFIAWKFGDYGYARFPLPDLRDGDPIFIREWNSTNGKWLKRVFGNFHFDSIIIYSDGRDRWTSHSTTYSENWRLPTKKELREAGMEGWYDGREIVLEDE